MDADLLKINCYGRAIFPAFGNQLDTGYPYRSIPKNLILKNTKNTGFIFCYKFKDPQHCPQPNKKTCLAAINESIRVFPQVVEAATQPPKVLLAHRRRHARGGEQYPPQLALSLLLELLQRADTVANGVLRVGRHAHHLAGEL